MASNTEVGFSKILVNGAPVLGLKGLFFVGTSGSVGVGSLLVPFVLSSEMYDVKVIADKFPFHWETNRIFYVDGLEGNKN